jgi:hypothetical protein
VRWFERHCFLAAPVGREVAAKVAAFIGKKPFAQAQSAARTVRGRSGRDHQNAKAAGTNPAASTFAPAVGRRIQRARAISRMIPKSGYRFSERIMRKKHLHQSWEP